MREGEDLVRNTNEQVVHGRAASLEMNTNTLRVGIEDWSAAIPGNRRVTGATLGAIRAHLKDLSHSGRGANTFIGWKQHDLLVDLRSGETLSRDGSGGAIHGAKNRQIRIAIKRRGMSNGGESMVAIGPLDELGRSQGVGVHPNAVPSAESLGNKVLTLVFLAMAFSGDEFSHSSTPAGSVVLGGLGNHGLMFNLLVNLQIHVAIRRADFRTGLAKVMHVLALPHLLVAMVTNLHPARGRVDVHAILMAALSTMGGFPARA